MCSSDLHGGGCRHQRGHASAGCRHLVGSEHGGHGTHHGASHGNHGHAYGIGKRDTLPDGHGDRDGRPGRGQCVV